MKNFLFFLSFIFALSASDFAYSEDWSKKKLPSAKTASNWNKPVQGYAVNSQQGNAPTVYVPPLQPPVDLSGSNPETVTIPQGGPSMTVSVPDNPSETISFPNSNPSETVTPLPGYSEPEETVEIPEGTGH